MTFFGAKTVPKWFFFFFKFANSKTQGWRKIPSIRKLYRNNIIRKSFPFKKFAYLYLLTCVGVLYIFPEKLFFFSQFKISTKQSSIYKFPRKLTLPIFLPHIQFIYDSRKLSSRNFFFLFRLNVQINLLLPRALLKNVGNFGPTFAQVPT